MSADFVEEARAFMLEHGLVPPESGLIADGELHRCGTEGKEREADGAYRLHLDPPATIWICNWRTGFDRTLTERGRSPLSAKERKIVEARNAEAKARAKAERDRMHRDGAAEAAKQYAAAKDATAHQYLRRKRVSVCPGLRIDSGGKLVVPLYGRSGEIQSLQRIDSEGNKLFLAGAKTQGGYFPVPATKGKEDGPLLIAEGLATALSCCEATGFAGVVAFNAGNLLPVAQWARQTFPERPLVVCADNDLETEAKGHGNPGKDKGEQAAREVGAYFALCPALEGKSTDFNDLAGRVGPESVRKVIDEALACCPAVQLPKGYFFDAKSRDLMVWRTGKKGDEYPEKVCPHVEVSGRTHGAAKWGYVLKWQDRRKECRTLAVPCRLFQTQRTELAELLADEGLEIAPGMLRFFKTFVLGHGDDLPIFRNVAQVGWDGDAYVLPDTTIGAAGRTIFQGPETTGRLYEVSGTLAEWQELARLAAGNTRLEMALAVAFAAPLLALAHQNGVVFHLVGGSSTGKTTAIDLAASVWGERTVQRKTWRATDNGLEGVCRAFNDGLLCLDELGEISPVALQQVAYMISEGRGKLRAARDGSSRTPLTWRVLALSTGEIALADKLREGGYRPFAGQQVRFVDVSVTAEDICNLHGRETAAALVDEISRKVACCYGSPGRAYLRALVDKIEETRKRLPIMLKDNTTLLCPKEATSQVERVARSFALAWVGGELAQELDILPRELNIEMAVHACFDAWLDSRGGLEPEEDRQILQQVTHFIEQHGDARFQAEGDDRVCINRAGMKCDDSGVVEYYFFPETFKREVIQGFNERRACDVLVREGLLKREGRRNKTRKQFNRLGRQAFYKIVLPSVPEDAEGEKPQSMPYAAEEYAQVPVEEPF